MASIAQMVKSRIKEGAKKIPAIKPWIEAAETNKRTDEMKEQLRQTRMKNRQYTGETSNGKPYTYGYESKDLEGLKAGDKIKGKRRY